MSIPYIFEFVFPKARLVELITNLNSMKTLTLSVCQQKFKEIISGIKKTEVREMSSICSFNYIVFKFNGVHYNSLDYLIEDRSDDYYTDGYEELYPIELIPINYEAIEFIIDHRFQKKKSVLVAVESADVLSISDNKEDLVYEYTDKSSFRAKIKYTLGKILNP